MKAEESIERSRVFSKRWVTLLGTLLGGFWSLFVPEASAQAPASLQKPPLSRDNELILYIPEQSYTTDEDPAKAKEIQVIERFFKAQNLAKSTQLLPFLDPTLYESIEQKLMMEARADACRNVREEIPPLELLEIAQEKLTTGQSEEALATLDQARQLLPCSQNRLNRSQIAQLLLWSGLAQPDPASASATRYLMAGIAADPLIVEHPKVPPESSALLQKIAYDIEHAANSVDVHLPQDQGDLWTHRNLILDGRRVVFDKIFIQLTPGIHYLQLTLPDEQIWGIFLDFVPGTTPDLAELARQNFSLTERYRNEFERVLSEGQGSPGFLAGLRSFAVQAEKKELYLAAISQSDNGPEITVRRFHIEKGIQIPDFRKNANQEINASPTAPVVVSRPFGVDLLAYATNIASAELGYRSPSAGVELKAFAQLQNAYRLGVMTRAGARSFRVRDTHGTPELRSDAEIDLGATFSVKILETSTFSIFPEIAYIYHINPLRGIPMYCSDIPSNGTASSPIYDCNLESADSGSSLLVNVRAPVHGPRAQIGLELQPFSRDLWTLRGLLRLGYSPLFSGLDSLIHVDATYEEPDGSSETSSMSVSIAPDSRSLIFHQFDIALGINGTY